MTDLSTPIKPSAMAMDAHLSGLVLRSVVIGLTAFLTVVDLFATQAILPALTRHYGVSPAAMGFAVNASTFGMAVAGLVVGLFSPRINRRTGILISLTLLAIPTSLLASAPNLAVFTVLRVVQGLCMASAFALTLAYLGEQCSTIDAGGAFAAYIAGNVASNLVGRLFSAALADGLGLAWNFYVFAALNLAGAILVFFTIKRVSPMHATMPATSPLIAAVAHWRNPSLRAAYGIGFCILFAFIGTFTFVNFVLVRPPLSLGMMDLGLVYFVFLPSVVTTLLAGRVASKLGTRPTIWGALAIAGLGLPLMLRPHLSEVLTGMVLVGVGTFFAQAAATAFVGQAAPDNRGIASGTYLACYFGGGLVGTAVLGRLFDAFGWPACVLGVGAALAAAGLLTFALKR
ncbi:MFS transporter [Bradyrhizobium sp. WBOS7]|uniref:MFS transporter n=1 Tax=Bradyrhizobium betae TaxID=244734 RepID=A0AAE9SU35_9BRAD|nr:MULTISPECIES: MFS transporter [Bradyrhizobium]MDD1569689.1 MFS transporter [Bradyrhizobium sp. WBOS1]UUO35826.1 MFS transporter [Bradyrhizobium sp. WBOS01]MDD1526378.1 MFS transporter [Bradyrhizobium sp. WBOS2]MDD1575788.1 MFS transporter [Bradyrhizobium sp. WBOS7]MDD1599623.1 MFS transporter [Bradyrhizobium sp. WBOS16]